MGEVEYNRQLLTRLARQAAEDGAKIIVFPECSITGYMDPGNDVKWTSVDKPDTGELDVKRVAELIPGPSTEYFAALAQELAVYLCIALAEKSEGKFYNAQVLLDPKGAIVAHHRKRSSWTPGDGLWMTCGDRPLQVVPSPYGRLGLMICHDFHILPKELKERNADIVLYSVGWYGPNTKSWFEELFPRSTVIPNKFSIVVANWSAEEQNPGWPGHGYSCIITDRGVVLSMAKSTCGSEIVFADLPIRKMKD
jgi:predicted amidohydrolase